MACFLLISLFVQNELSYDGYHRNAQQIYKLMREKYKGGTIRHSVVTPPPMSLALLDEFPTILRAVRFFNPDNPAPLVRYKDKRFYERRFFFADASSLEVFSVSLTRGNPETALEEPYSVVISEDMATKYFGDEDPIGRTIRFKNRLDFRVTGILGNVPRNSHLQFDFLASFDTLRHWLGDDYLNNWHNPMCHTYLLLQKGYLPTALERQLPGFVQKHLESNGTERLYLRSLPRVHVYSEYGDISQIYILSAISAFILLVACINYTNLSTARFLQRAKEVGVRKALGAHRSQIFEQFLGESVFFSLFALFLAIALVELVMPSFNAFVGKDLKIGYGDPQVLLVLSGIVILVGVVGGGYPAMILSAFQPSEVLIGRFKSRVKSHCQLKLIGLRGLFMRFVERIDGLRDSGHF